MKEILVSIIIPIYNAGTYLTETIECAIHQTYSHKEIILVDDGSSDNSYELAKQFECSYVRVIKQENAGAAVARNTGLAHASGDYIQFLDAGDLMSADKIEKQVKMLAGSKTKLAVCNFLQFSNRESLINCDYPDQSAFIHSSTDTVDFLVNLWGGNMASFFIQTNSWLVPKSLIEKGGLWRNYRCPDDDGEFFARMILASEGIIHVDGVYNYYRVESGSNQLSTNKNRKYLHNTLLTIDLKHKYLKDKGGHPLMAKAFARQYKDFAVYNYPQQKVLSKIAIRRYQSLNYKVDAPLLGSIIIEVLKKVFGWRLARIVRFYMRGI